MGAARIIELDLSCDGQVMANRKIHWSLGLVMKDASNIHPKLTMNTMEVKGLGSYQVVSLSHWECDTS